MGIYVDNDLKYVVNANSLNTKLSLNPGDHKTVVQEWDLAEVRVLPPSRSPSPPPQEFS